MIIPIDPNYKCFAGAQRPSCSLLTTGHDISLIVVWFSPVKRSFQTVTTYILKMMIFNLLLHIDVTLRETNLEKEKDRETSSNSQVLSLKLNIHLKNSKRNHDYPCLLSGFCSKDKSVHIHNNKSQVLDRKMKH